MYIYIYIIYVYVSYLYFSRTLNYVMCKRMCAHTRNVQRVLCMMSCDVCTSRATRDVATMHDV